MLCKRKGLIEKVVPINIVINRMNYRTLPDTIMFFNSMGFQEFRLNFMRPEGRAFSNFDRLSVRYSDCLPFIRKATELTKTGEIGITLEGFPFCILNGMESPERFVGELKDYLNMVVSFNDSKKRSITKDTFLWKKRRTEELKAKGRDCWKCRYYSICEGVWKGYAENMGFGEFKPVSD